MTDDDADLKLWVERELRETRHSLRNDITVMGTKIADAVLNSTKDVAELRAAVMSIERATTQIGPLQARVEALEKSDAADQATRRVKRFLWVQTLALAGLLVAMCAVVVAIAQH